VDALDELDDSLTDAINIFREIERTSKLSNTKSTVKICLASRPHPGIFDEFKESLGFRLEDYNKKDIQIYVERGLGRILQADDMQEAHRNLATQISERANGVFLWAYLVVRDICEGWVKGDNIEDLARRLDGLPKGLENLYRHILDNVKPQYRVELKAMLQIVSLADEDYGRLNIDEFRLALAFALSNESSNSSQLQLGPSTQAERSRTAQRVRVITGGLLEVSEGNLKETMTRPTEVMASITPRIIVEINNKQSDEDLPRISNDNELPERSSVASTNNSMSEPRRKIRWRAGRKFVRKILKIANNVTLRDSKEIISVPISLSEPRSSLYQDSPNHSRHVSLSNDAESPNSNALEVYSSGDNSIIELSFQDNDGDTQDSLPRIRLIHGTLGTFLAKLDWAVEMQDDEAGLQHVNGHHLLLEICAKYTFAVHSVCPVKGDTFPKDFFPLISYAWSRTPFHARAVEQLGRRSSFPIIKEAFNGHPLLKGIAYNSLGYFDTPAIYNPDLINAAYHGLLLYCRDRIKQPNFWDINRPDSHILRAAVNSGSCEMVQLMLQNGALISPQYKQSIAAICDAVGMNNMEITKILINEGADVNAVTMYRSGYGRMAYLTPLMIAIIARYQDIALLLIESGASVNTYSHIFATPLDHAMWNFNACSRMQETLLAKGAQTEYHVPLEEYPRSVLLGAIRKVSISELWQKPIDLLISSGADIFCDCGTSSPLEAAVGNVFVGVSLNVTKAALRKWSLWLQVLNGFTTVDTRVLSERCRWYRILKKSIVNAARIGRIALMDRLIKAGADPFLQFPGELSPLEAAARAGSVRAVRSLILVHGVDPKWYGEEWWRSQQARLLRLSLNEGDASLISFFIDQNKDILKNNT
jgi:ankyrin repeat protein